MKFHLPYGRETAIDLNVPDSCDVRDHIKLPNHQTDNLFGDCQAVLESPNHFPPLKDAVVPGDQIAIVLDYALPAAPTVVAAAVDSFLQADVEPRQIQLVIAEHEPKSGVWFLSELPADVAKQINIVRHEAENQEKLSYVAASEAGDPIYVNTTIYDADVVLPVSIMRPNGSLGYHGIYSSLFPLFSDAKTGERFARQIVDRQQKTIAQLQREVDEAVWLMGVQMGLQVLPGPNDTVAQVRCGELRTSAIDCEKIADEHLLSKSDETADCVIATVHGDQNQTWDHFARALHTASRFVKENGVVAICTNLEDAPGVMLRKLAAIEKGVSMPIAPMPEMPIPDMRMDDDDDEEELAPEEDVADLPPAVFPPDTSAALLLDQCLGQFRVYLLSQLDSDTVEPIGLAHIASTDELSRLCQQFESCIVIENADKIGSVQ